MVTTDCIFCITNLRAVILLFWRHVCISVIANEFVVGIVNSLRAGSERDDTVMVASFDGVSIRPDRGSFFINTTLVNPVSDS